MTRFPRLLYIAPMLIRILLSLCLATLGLAQTTGNSGRSSDPKPGNDGLRAAQALLDEENFDAAVTAFQSLVEKNHSSAEAQAGLIDH